MSGITIAVIIVVIVGIYFAVTYNAFVTLRNRIKEAWSDIEVQMKRRYDLIPNLVETVKGYAAHESSTLEKVIQARNMAMAPHNNMQDVAKSENMLTGALKSIFALSESYPRPESQPKLFGIAARTARYGGQTAGRTPLLQRQCAGL